MPQVAFLRIFQGPGAWLNGAFLVLGEGAAVTALLFEAFFVDEAMVDVFDAVLVHKGLEHLVETTRPVDANTALTASQRLGKPHHATVYSPFSLRQIVEFVLLLPLNFVPWIGVPLFLWLTGYRAGPLQHWRYFKLKDLNKDERKTFIRGHRLGYTAYALLFPLFLSAREASNTRFSFGVGALTLQLVPVLSMLFLLTTATGSALWAAELERGSHDEHAGDSRHHDPPPTYEDYEDDPV